MKKSVLLIAIFAGMSMSVLAQGRPDPQVPQGENLKVPEGWEVRTDQPMEDLTISDDPESGDLYFVNMTPGWHITTGPRGIFWHPANEASGIFKVHTKLHYFDPNGRNREGYGLFFGGKNLKADNQEYIYFLLRNTGDFLIKKRSGSETSVIKDWTASSQIKVFGEDTETSVENNLEVSVNAGMMKFFINGKEVFSIGTDGLDPEGIFGLRVNHAVNLHIEDLGLAER
jgi:hypothetical protein